MPNVLKDRTSIGNRILEYFRIDATDFEVRRLEESPLSAAKEYCDFIHNEPNAPALVIAARRLPISSTIVNPILLRDLTGRIRFTSLRSLASYWSKHYLAELIAAGSSGLKSTNISAVLDFFNYNKEYEYLDICWPPTGFACSPPEISMLIGSIGLLESTSVERLESIVTASGYSVITQNEIVFPFQSIRDPIGYRVEQGRTTSLPLYNRPAAMQAENGEVIFEYPKLHDFYLLLLDKEYLIDLGGHSRDLQVYASYLGVTRTPKSDEAIELVVVEDMVVAICNGGDVPVPFAGIIVSGNRRSLSPRLIEGIVDNPYIEIRRKDSLHIENAIQCGPMLVSRGEVLESGQTLIREQFVPGREAGVPVVPAALHISGGATSAARCCIATDRDGLPFAIVVEGLSSGAAAQNHSTQSGATFDEIAQLAVRLGAVNAMSLDSGGSVGLYRDGQALVRTGDYRWKSSIRSPRPLAHAVIFT